LRGKKYLELPYISLGIIMAILRLSQNISPHKYVLLTFSLRDIRSNNSPPEANSMTIKMSDGVSMNS